MKKIFYFILIFTYSLSNTYSQSNFQKFKNLSSPKKWWVIYHPFKAKKAFTISHEAKAVADSIRKTGILGKKPSGTKLDAFRHSFWMAYLGKNIGIQAAKLLGKAHEKESYLLYEEKKLEDGTLPDKPSMDMDLHNNEIGLNIIKQNKYISKKDLIEKVIEYVNKGEMLIIKRNHKNRYVTCDGDIISKDSLRIWNNKKCLVKSNSI